jgi:hypothetical protein
VVRPRREEERGDRSLHVGGAAAVDPVAGALAEGVAGPALSAEGDGVEVAVEQQRPVGLAGQRRHEVRLRGFGDHPLGLQPPRVHPAVDPLDGLAGTAGRVAGVEGQQRAQQLRGLVVPLADPREWLRTASAGIHSSCIASVTVTVDRY